MDGFTWVKNEATGGTPWQCPDAVLDEMAELGHVPCEEPESVDPAMAEHRAQAARRAAEQAAAEAAKETKSTKAAAGGKAEKE
ncbi:MAG TPA: hypothetical protein VIP77_16190 [Jiangellaceae bacterium]